MVSFESKLTQQVASEMEQFRDQEWLLLRVVALGSSSERTTLIQITSGANLHMCLPLLH